MRQPSLSKQVGIFLAFCAAMAIVSPAQTLTTLGTFDYDNGDNPQSIIQGNDGNFYGTTAQGGTNYTCHFGTRGCGTVFQVTTEGTLTLLYNFCVQPNCADGSNPAAGLVQATDGNFYGTTYFGGIGGHCYDPNTCGTVFKITPEGTLTTLYNFCAQNNCLDGYNPAAGLVQGADGNFYGTSFRGGANGNGTVFKITPSGTLTTLYSFTNDADGANPSAGLVQATDGNLYGTTSYGYGTVFRITLQGRLTTLHSFDGADGSGANALVQATDGNFYGTTQSGGANNNCYHNYGCGTVFKMTPGGGLTTLYSFCAEGYPCTDGAYPYAGLMQATDGNFYGTTGGGGAYSYDDGTIFKITASGALSTLHSFDSTDGASPQGTLVQATNRVFYGTTVAGGTGGCGTPGCGTVFSLSVTPSILSFSPRIGRVGTSVVITGENFTGATSVSFGSVQAREFTVESTTEIRATVPEGARTGLIGVTTPGGTATSADTFRVL